MGKSTSVFTKEQNNRRDRVRSCLVRQERNTHLTVCLSLFNLKDCTEGHSGTGASLLRSAKRFWTLDLYCFLFGKVASSVVEGRTPWIYSGECQMCMGIATCYSMALMGWSILCKEEMVGKYSPGSKSHFCPDAHRFHGIRDV